MLCFKCLYRLPCCVVMVVTAVALEVVVATTARFFLAQAVVVAHRHRSSVPAICQGHLAAGTCAFARREVWVAVRSSQSPGTSKFQLGNWFCEFGMNVLVCVCVCGLLLLRFRSSVLRLVLVLTFEGKKNKHSASWPPAPALSNKTLQGLCILPGGAPTHRRWHFNTIQIVPSHPNSFTTMVRVL